MSPIQTTPRALVMLTVFCLTVGFWQIGEGSWIYAKARLAQILLERAWTRALAGEIQAKPWPWADTWPIARLRVPSEQVDLIVLNGAYGRTLAFGPAFAESSALPGAGGTTLLTGHRDTHFAFLRRLKEADEVVIDTLDGSHARYRVHDISIVDAETASIGLRNDDPEQLVLLTCYPFDDIRIGSRLRYVVTAIRAPSVPPRSSDKPGGRESEARRESMPPG